MKTKNDLEKKSEGQMKLPVDTFHGKVASCTVHQSLAWVDNLHLRTLKKNISELEEKQSAANNLVLILQYVIILAFYSISVFLLWLLQTNYKLLQFLILITLYLCSKSGLKYKSDLLSWTNLPGSIGQQTVFEQRKHPLWNLLI